MKSFFSGVSTPPSLGVGFRSLRPLLFVAGAAAAATGAYYLFSYKFGDRQRRKKTVHAGIQTTPEDPDPRLKSAFHLVEPSLLPEVDFCIRRLIAEQAEVVTEENGQVTVSPSFFGPLITYTSPKLFWEHLLLRLGFGKLQSSSWTLQFSYIRWHNKGSASICIRRHYVLLMNGAVTQSWWILTNDFFLTSNNCPIWYAGVYRATYTERVEGHLSRVGSYSFTKHLNEETFAGTQVVVQVHTYQALVISDDAWIASVRSASEVIPTNSKPDPSSPSSPQPSPDPEEESPPEAWEVPALYAFTDILGINNFPLKLSALRQAFNIILSNTDCRNRLSVAGRMIFGQLASLNAMNLNAFQQAYDMLLAAAQDPSSYEGILKELALIGIQHYNFIDIVYEVVLLRVLEGIRPEIPVVGGFLDHLMVMISLFSGNSEQRRPRAEAYLLIFKRGMLLLLQNIFTLEESAYVAPGSLATAVWNSIQHHIEQLMESLNAI